MPNYLPIRYTLFWEELRRRMRGDRLQLVLFIYTLLLIAILFFVTQFRDISSTNPREWPIFGKELWQIYLVAQMVLVMFISPALTAGAFSAEREQGTLDMLLLTRMSSKSIVLGKFFGAIGQMLFLLLAGLPIISVVFFYGGVSPGDVVLGYSLTIVTALGYASLGFFMSCRCKRVVTSVVCAYGLMLLLAVVLPALLGVMYATSRPHDPDSAQFTVSFIMASNPLASYSIAVLDGESGRYVIALWLTFLEMLTITLLLLRSSITIVQRMRGLPWGVIHQTWHNDTYSRDLREGQIKES